MAAILADDTFKCIFLNEKNKILLDFVSKSPIENKPPFV